MKILLTLILTIFFIAGCTKTPTDVIPTEQNTLNESNQEEDMGEDVIPGKNPNSKGKTPEAQTHS